MQMEFRFRVGPRFTRLAIWTGTSLLLTSLSFSTPAAPAKAWLENVPASAGNWRSWTELPTTAFFEVPASRLASAQYALARTAYALQTQAGVAHFGRPDFICPDGTKPYLLRALYINGGTGDFGVAWAGSALVVSHAALGSGGPPSESALVACLSQQPTAVYSDVSSAL